MPRKLIDATSLPVRDLWLHDDTCAGRPVRAVLVEDIEKAGAVEVPDRQSKPCAVCYGGKQGYRHTLHTTLFVDTFGKKRVLLVESSGCPPFAECALKDKPLRSAFAINFCPECGRDLRKETEVE